MGIFDNLKFKAEELFGTLDADDVKERLADLHDELEARAGELSEDQKAAIVEKIEAIKAKHAHLIGGATAAGETSDGTAKSLDTLFTGGSIITMAGDAPEYVEALGVSEGRIAFVGSAADAESLAGEATNRVDLAGGALMPGFIDTHGHIVLAAHQIEQAWLRGADVKNIPQLIQALKDKAEENGVAEGDWIVGSGWHAAVLEEGRYPTADDLDLVSTTNPVMAIHASAHQASVNHKALELAGYGPGVADPEGGIIARVEDTDIPNGYLEEAPVFYMRSLVAPISPDKHANLMDRAMTQWASFGFTTAQEDCLGSGAADDFDMLDGALADSPAKIDIIIHVEPQHEATARERYGDRIGSYVDGVRLGGVKIFLDGSLGGGTAWTATPYEGGDNTGVARMSDEDLIALIDQYYDTDMQIQAHQNADAAIDQFFKGVQSAIAKHGKLDKRPVAIHCQLVRPEQWATFAELGVIPSLYTSSIPEQVDITAGLVGDRVNQHNATADATAAGLKWTSHLDAPLLLPDAMQMIDGCVNRRSLATGRVYAPEQAVGAYEAFQSITSAAAYQLFEEGSKGTLEVGKLADLVVLNVDPLKIDPAEINSVKVQATYKNGNEVYSAS